MAFPKLDRTEILDQLRALVLQEAGVRAGNLPTRISGLSVVRRVEKGLKLSFSEPYLALVLQGRKRTFLGEKEYEYSAGQMVVTGIGVPSRTIVEEASEDKPFLSIVIRVDKQQLAQTVQSYRYLFEDSLSDAMAVTWAEDDFLLAFGRYLSLLGEEVFDEKLAEAIYRELMVRLLSSELGPIAYGMTSLNSRIHRISKALDMIRGSLRTSIKIENLADASNMSVSTFNRHFRALTGVSPLQYQKQLKLYEARHLLQFEKYSVSQTAFDLGYSSLPQFSKEYKNFFGNSPSAEKRA